MSFVLMCFLLLELCAVIPKTVWSQDLCRSITFTKPREGYSLYGHVIKNLTTTTASSCKNLCTMESQCVSVNISPPLNGKVVCELSDSDHVQHPADLKLREGYIYRATQNYCSDKPCKNNGKCLNGFTEKKYVCECKSGYTGDNCEKVINDCSDALPSNGIVHIWNHGPELFRVYCDQTSDGGGWTMIFKVVRGISLPVVGDLWNSKATQSESISAALDTTNTFAGHVKNRVVMNWQKFNPKEARVVLYQNGTEAISLKFNASGSNNLNWFSQERLISSPWNDLKDATNITQFAIVALYFRFFDIALSRGGCGYDSGWLVIANYPGCMWEQRYTVSILFSTLDRAVTWMDYGNVGIADVLAVFVR